MDEHLALWTARLEALSTRASAAVQNQFPAELLAWKAAGHAAVARLIEIHVANGDPWDLIELELEAIWQTIELAVHDAEAGRPMPPAGAARRA